MMWYEVEGKTQKTVIDELMKREHRKQNKKKKSNNNHRCHCPHNFDSLIPFHGVRESPSSIPFLRFFSFSARILVRSISCSLTNSNTVFFLCSRFSSKWVFFRRVRGKWKGGFISFGPIALVSITHGRGTLFSKTMSSEASKSNPLPQPR